MSFWKKCILPAVVFTAFCFSAAAKSKPLTDSTVVKKLESNNKKNSILVAELSLKGLNVDTEGKFTTDTVKSSKFTVQSEVDLTDIQARLDYANKEFYTVEFKLLSSKPKIYTITRIDGVESVAEYLIRLEKERKQLVETLLKPGKDYENQKLWVNALSFYYDLLTNPELSGIPEVKEAYTTIADAIRSGNPGLGTYSAFKFADAWKSLCKEFEELCVQNCTKDITASGFTNCGLDYETRTGSYRIKFQFSGNRKYETLRRIVLAGYKKAYKPDWREIEKEWGDYNFEWTEIAEGLGGFFPGNVKSSLTGTYSSAVNKKNYQLDFIVTDATGKNLLGNRIFTAKGDTPVIISGVEEDKMELLENGTAIVKITAVGFIHQGILHSFSNDNGFNAAGENVSCVLAVTDMAVIPDANIRMLATEVTQDLYKAVTGENPSLFKGSNLPVERVSWLDAVKFCNKLSEKEGLEPAYIISDAVTLKTNTTGYRLPTVKEWESAAKAGRNNQYSGSETFDDAGWYEENSGFITHEAGTKNPNAYGLFDMSGNVQEWCFDAYSGNKRITRGGSCVRGSDFTISKQDYDDTETKDGDLGFRIVCSQ